MNLSSLADFAALKKLAAALWQTDPTYQGAAIMIGAGFSRAAASTGDVRNKLPLWNDFSKIIMQELQSNGADPLRLAEEYLAYFGRHALNNLIKTMINDAAWVPGVLHNNMLELPWSEVITTNWDTLLERAAEEIHQRTYTTVVKQEDLASASSPRIVKLHGTISITEDLVFTQEDYRRYPQRYAVFVNFVRQVFVENELCLLGFSGDDPNFLQWTGWVRDQLGLHAKRIYLVGALGLSSARRKYLESINVVPIDLWELVSEYDDADLRHSNATRLFLDALNDLKPKPAWEWQLTRAPDDESPMTQIDQVHKDPSFAAKIFEQRLSSFAADRKSYPGWVVCPSGKRWELASQFGFPFPTQESLAAMKTDDRHRLLYEMAWRHNITYETIPIWLGKELLDVCDPKKNTILSKNEQFEILLLILNNARWFHGVDEFNSISKIAESIILENGRFWPDGENEILFYRARLAKGRFDYAAVEKSAEAIDASDSVWKLRKAYLLAEIGRFDEGEVLVREAYKELLIQHRRDRNSIFILSRLAFSHWLLQGIEFSENNSFVALPDIYQLAICAPRDHLDYLDRRIASELTRQQRRHEVQPLFRPGRYTDNSKSLHFSNEVHPVLVLDGISRSIGIPVRWKNISFLVEPTAKLAELQDMDNLDRFPLAIHAASSESSDVLKTVFSRTQVARFSAAEVAFLLDHCVDAVKYWSNKIMANSGVDLLYVMNRLRVFMEVLARISIRATPENAGLILDLALSSGQKREFQHIWLIEPLKNLIEFSLESIPQNLRHKFLYKFLQFPLEAELQMNVARGWPNPLLECVAERSKNAVLDRRIDELIDFTTPSPAQNGAALLRLLPLLENEFLTPEETEKISIKLWGEIPNYKVMPQFGLLECVLLELPAKNRCEVRSLIRGIMFDCSENYIVDHQVLRNVIYSARAKNIMEFPDCSQANEMFKSLVDWRKKGGDMEAFGRLEDYEQNLATLIAQALAYSVIPSLPVFFLTEINYIKAAEFQNLNKTPDVVIGLVHFAAANERFADDVEGLIRKGLQSREAVNLTASAQAILVWRNLQASPVIDRLILRLVYLLGSNYIIGLPTLLSVVRELAEKDYLSSDVLLSLAETVPMIFDGANYDGVYYLSREAIDVSLVRAECVKLARKICSIGLDSEEELHRILGEAQCDALPEVRFA
ncbi:SIR2 family protein [Achromobacter dolens]|uniref:SIR2 family NAD-dependent protein deacylase n=1 Tax=Achromobacter dolens TaxID=1287738 RepID=UPI0022B86CA5|nr:SIR2 family protein [Achromobacter dolens]MCZ8406590.1 SIR2 family protein [Achromobacter dolens]